MRRLDNLDLNHYRYDMEIRQLTEDFYVAPQLSPEDMAALAEAGIRTVICNRPDGEVPPSHSAATMQAAAEAAGLDFHSVPLTHQSFTPDNIARQRGIATGSDGACLAYCASGTRSCFAWAMGAVEDHNLSDVIEIAARAGYDLGPIQPLLSSLMAARGE